MAVVAGVLAPALAGLVAPAFERSFGDSSGMLACFIGCSVGVGSLVAALGLARLTCKERFWWLTALPWLVVTIPACGGIFFGGCVVGLKQA